MSDRCPLLRQSALVIGFVLIGSTAFSVGLGSVGLGGGSAEAASEFRLIIPRFGGALELKQNKVKQVWFDSAMIDIEPVIAAQPRGQFVSPSEQKFKNNILQRLLFASDPNQLLSARWRAYLNARWQTDMGETLGPYSAEFLAELRQTIHAWEEQNQLFLRLFAANRKLQRHGLQPNGVAILIDVETQLLFFQHNDRIAWHAKISTSENGLGQLLDSEKTPIGSHQIAFKVGKNVPIGTVFSNLRRTRKRLSPTALRSPRNGLISTRILGLTGLESGINLGGRSDTRTRGIFIHGTNQEQLLGTPASNGCIRMSNADVVRLFKETPSKSFVEIIPLKHETRLHRYATLSAL